MAANSDEVRQNAPAISIVIVSWNTIDLLRACLSSIKAVLELPAYEVIVVDNGSKDGSASMVSDEFPQVILIKNEDNRGFGQATNQGYAVSRGEYCLVLNSDTEASLETIERCKEYLDAHDDVAAVGCRLTYPSGRFQSSCFRFPSLRGVVCSSLGLSKLFPNSSAFNFDRYGHQQWDEPREVNCVMGSFMLLRRKALHPSYLFDMGYFMYAEETELCWVMARDGWKVVYFPEVSIVHHLGGSSRRDPVVAAWSYEGVRRGTLRFLYRNRGVLRAYLVNMIFLLTLVPRAPYWSVSDFVASVRKGMVARSKSLQLRVLPFHLKVLAKPSAMNEPWGGPK